jgi:hypothetical protein
MKTVGHICLTDLEENRSADHLPEQIWSIESDPPDITAVLQRIYEAEKKYRGEIREMLMRSDSFALSPRRTMVGSPRRSTKFEETTMYQYTFQSLFFR